MVVGGKGQLGHELSRMAPNTWRLVSLDLPEFDLTSTDSVRSALATHAPALVINAAAYTAVDRAESEPDRAALVNEHGAGLLARAADSAGARMIHVSTDFVFDGSLGRPYAPEDEPHPLGVYGATKLAGERLVRQHTRDQALVLRTAWLYGSQGANFVRTMLRLLAGDTQLRVVADQVGTPTWARSLAKAIWTAAARPNLRGVHHWTDAGVASWYDFAVAVREEAITLGLMTSAQEIDPVTTADFPTAARRPAYSVLAKERTWAALELRPPHWRVNLRLALEEMRES